jgi:hypothetical protein
MKKGSLCIAFLVFCFSARAQRLISYFELYGAGGILKNTGYYEDYMKPKPGYSAGVGMGHVFSRSFQVSLRALWEAKGSKWQEHVMGKSSWGDIDKMNYTSTDFHYLTFSLAPEFRIQRLRNLSLGAGGYYSVLQQASIGMKDVDNISHTTTLWSNSFQGNFRDRYDAGISVYIGYPVIINDKNCTTLRLVYNKGLVDIHDVWNGGQRNNSIMLSAAFAFRNPF